MKQLFFAITAVLCCTTSYAYERQIKISEKVVHDRDFKYIDRFGDEYLIHLSRSTPEYTIYTDEMVCLTDVNTNIEYLVMPEEQLDVYKDTIRLQFTPNYLPIRQNELYFFKALAAARADTNIVMEPLPTDAKLEEILTREQEQLGAEQKFAQGFLDNYTLERPVTDTFKTFASQYINAQLVRKLIHPLIVQRKPLKELEKKQANFLIECINYNIDNPQVKMLIEDYLILTLQDIKGRKLLKEKKELSNTFSEENYDYVVFNMMKNGMLYGNAAGKYYHVNEQKENDYKSYINDLSNFKTKANNNTLVQDMKGETKTLLESLSNKTEKYYYVYFWSSQSANIAEDMKQMQRLSNSYRIFPVDIVFVCLDQNPIVWKKLCREYNINDEERNYIVPGGYGGKLAKNYKIKKLPQYLIIDNNGYVLNINAPKPTEETMSALLDKYNNIYGSNGLNLLGNN